MIITFIMSVAMWVSISSLAAAQTTPQVTAARHVADRIALFETSDPHLYYLVPERWQKRAVYLERTDDPDQPLTLTVIMGPSYQWADSLRYSIRSQDPFAVFLPVPKRYTSTTVRFPENLASTLSSLQPSDELSSGDLIYLRAKLSDDGLRTLRTVAAGETLVTGLLTYDFPYQDGVFPIVSELWLNLTPADLNVGAGTPNAVPGWYRDVRSDSAVPVGSAGGSLRNGRCDGRESCVFVDELTDLYWSKHRLASRKLNTYEWIAFCEGLSYGGYDDWRLPAKAEVALAVTHGLWSRLRGAGALFYRDMGWGSVTTSFDVNAVHSWHLTIDGPAASLINARRTVSDRGLCVRDGIANSLTPPPQIDIVQPPVEDPKQQAARANDARQERSEGLGSI